MTTETSNNGAPPTKILVIEDDALTRLTLCNIFGRMNYATIEASNGIAGMQMFRQEKPDIVVTDLLMPDKEGLETITEIRALDPYVKIIAMSGGGSTHNLDFLQLARKFGANYTLSKPFRPTDILELLQNIQPVKGA